MICYRFNTLRLFRKIWRYNRCILLIFQGSKDLLTILKYWWYCIDNNWSYEPWDIGNIYWSKISITMRWILFILFWYELVSLYRVITLIVLWFEILWIIIRFKWWRNEKYSYRLHQWWTIAHKGSDTEHIQLLLGLWMKIWILKSL